MNSHIVLLAFAGFVVVMLPSGVWMMREMRREERVVARVRMVHGQPPVVRKTAETAAVRAAATHAMAAIGQAILRSGMVPARTLTELESTLAASGLRGSQGVGVFVGAKILALIGLPLLTWLLVRDLGVTGILATVLPAAGGVAGLLAPDWLVRRQRKRYLARIEQGLPDALDMLVICTQAGLGMGPAIIRVASELQGAYGEIAKEFETTANELQIISDSRLAVINLGQRTGLDSLKRLATTLVQTLQYGTPVSDALRVLSSEMRQEMLTRCEARAARLPVLLTLPTMFFILPCVFLIAGGPAIITVMRSFHH
ncbi:MAG TPA: type II secretion system F family protein [Acetobacteraceae bacterium]|nr:type II secretion system F family protein [Acetobacteraceae bacterium]